MIFILNTFKIINKIKIQKKRQPRKKDVKLKNDKQTISKNITKLMSAIDISFYKGAGNQFCIASFCP